MRKDPFRGSFLFSGYVFSVLKPAILWSCPLGGTSKHGNADVSSKF